ncbi:MAG: hypothetical protein AAFY65_04825 [Pseudomonadota bacterium]
MVLESEGIANGNLPVAQLAAQMRLPDGYETVPGQSARLQQRLRAAIVSLERRIAKALLRRDFVLGGPVKGGGEVFLPLAPVWGVSRVELLDAGGGETLPNAEISGGQMAPCLSFGRALSQGAYVRITADAGWGTWDDVPEPLAEAALLMAEALDTGEGPAVNEVVDGLVAPWRLRRLGGLG